VHKKPVKRACLVSLFWGRVGDSKICLILVNNYTNDRKIKVQKAKKKLYRKRELRGTRENVRPPIAPRQKSAQVGKKEKRLSYQGDVAQ